MASDYRLVDPEDEVPMGPAYERRLKVNLLLTSGIETYREVFHSDPPADIEDEVRSLNHGYPHLFLKARLPPV